MIPRRRKRLSAHARIPALDETGYVVLDRHDHSRDAREWEDVAYVDSSQRRALLMVLRRPRGSTCPSNGKVIPAGEWQRSRRPA